MNAEEDLLAGLDATSDASAPSAPVDTRIARRIGRALATRRSRIIAGVAVTTVVLASGTGAVYAATQRTSGDYRTAVAETADVSETLSLSGQLASSSSADVAFQVDGTVAEVLVALGDTVAAGQQLAALDTSDLQESVTNAEDAAADAAQTLEDDLEAQSGGTSSSTSTSASSSSAPSSSSGSGATGSASTSSSSSSGTGSSGGAAATGPETQKAIEDISVAQEALLAQYEATTTANGASTAALAQAQTVCAPFLSATLGPGDAASDDATTGGTAADDDATSGGAPSGDATSGGTTADDDGAAATAEDLQSALVDAQASLADCQAAITASQDAQTATTTAATALTEAAAALDEKVAALQALSGTTAETAAGTTESLPGATGTPTTSSAATSSSTSAPGASSSPSGAGTSGSTTITAERILSDQAAIDLADAELAIARQNLTFAAITSPIDGTVVSVAIAAGDSVSAGSSSSIITIQGDGGYIVQATVPLSKIPGVETGQKAEIALPAFGATYSGSVSSIGVLNVSETSTPSYTVTVAVDAGTDSPRIGATADVEIELSVAVGVLTVPTSAVTRSGTDATVVRLVDGKPQTVAVTVGTVGSERTEIADGLAEGDTVVLADLSQAITTDDSSSSTGLTGFGGTSGQLPGGGSGFPGGFPSGGVPSGGGFQAPAG